ncbi:MAG: hypothetical protein WD355_07440 [Balneolaceae bacterium]
MSPPLLTWLLLSMQHVAVQEPYALLAGPEWESRTPAELGLDDEFISRIYEAMGE